MFFDGTRFIEKFIDHIESDAVERQLWLARVREVGFDMALLEFLQKNVYKSRQT